MSKVKNSYFITDKQVENFKIWMIKQNINIGMFALRCGVTRQYICGVLNRQWRITHSVVETFKKGGYNLE